MENNQIEEQDEHQNVSAMFCMILPILALHSILAQNIFGRGFYKNEKTLWILGVVSLLGVFGFICGLISNKTKFVKVGMALSTITVLICAMTLASL